MSAIKNVINGPLKSKLVELIRLRGPLTVADYMKIVLTNPESGFYMNDDVFGVKGHFTTNPEISQMFGEILGVWILQEWRRFSCPKPLRLVEFGPGRGTLMSDITRTLNNFKETHDNIHVSMIEMSSHLMALQEKALANGPIKNLLDRTTWHTAIESLPEEKQGFTAYVAHEFLDALPIHKFVRDPKESNAWRELLIDYDHREELRFCISKQPSLSTHLLIPSDFEGNHIEVCPQAALHVEKVATQLNKVGKGCMLICDYGFEEEPADCGIDGADLIPSLKPIKSARDTFRAFKNHEPWPALKDPGEADLTADVDFGYLKRHLKDKATVFGTVNQSDFLIKCGLQARLSSLLGKVTEEKEREDLVTGADMMINDMGERYKFLAVFPKDSTHLFVKDPPAGFDEGA